MKGFVSKLRFVESWSALMKTRSSSRSHLSPCVALLLNGSRRASLWRGWGGGGRWSEVHAAVGPGPLLCGMLLISTGCANNYISELLLNQLEKQYNSEPVELMEDLKGLCNSRKVSICV